MKDYGLFISFLFLREVRVVIVEVIFVFRDWISDCERRFVVSFGYC